MNKTLKLACAILLCQSAGFIGSIFTASAIVTWYRQLIKPDFAPPNWIFGPVWLTLYTLMGISLFRIWQKKSSERFLNNKQSITSALHFFYIHLILNASWSIVFFGIKDVFSALILLITLVIMIGTLIVWFYRYDKTAAFLLVPYFLWGIFAAYLNFTIWNLNYQTP